MSSVRIPTTFAPGMDWASADPLAGVTEPLPYFRNPYYFALNHRRTEHLVSLALPLPGLGGGVASPREGEPAPSVLEVGAGIGDLTTFWLDRGWRVTATEAREDNLRLLRTRLKGEPLASVMPLDLDEAKPEPNPEPKRPPSPAPAPGALAPLSAHDVVFCFGVLYHLQRPAEALALLAPLARRAVLLETVVSYGEGEDLNPVPESVSRCSQSLRGVGCRPTRGWVLARLREHFPHAYISATQPNSREFPTDWTVVPERRWPNPRAVFVASREALSPRGRDGRPTLLDAPPARQEAH